MESCQLTLDTNITKDEVAFLSAICIIKIVVLKGENVYVQKICDCSVV